MLDLVVPHLVLYTFSRNLWLNFLDMLLLSTLLNMLPNIICEEYKVVREDSDMALVSGRLERR